MVTNQNNELIHTRTVTGWRVCVDYRKLNKVTRKDHFPLLVIDQMLDKLAGQDYYCFFDGYSRYNQIAICPDDQEKQDSLAHMVPLLFGECHLNYGMHQKLFKDV